MWTRVASMLWYLLFFGLNLLASNKKAKLLNGYNGFDNLVLNAEIKWLQMVIMV